MKRAVGKLVLILKTVLFVTILISIIPACSGEERSAGLSWPSAVIEAYTAESGGVWYPRLVELENGDWLMSFDTNEDGGNTVIKVVRSTDQGETWGSAVTAVDEPSGNSANGQMLQLDNGDIWLAYRLVEDTGEGGVDTYLRVRVSHDNGYTWSELPNGQIDAESADDFKGVWEPHLEYIGNTIAVMYAHDGPSVAGRTNMQNILMKTWEGNGWSNPITVVDGVDAGSRDGMPVFTRMENGEYMLVFEASNKPAHPFVIKCKTSPDGFNWSGERHELYTPSGAGKKAGAPFVSRLDDGTLIVSFQTDEDSTNTGDAYSSMKTVLSFDEGQNWTDVHHPFPAPDDRNSNWNALMPVNSENGDVIVAATSANYPQPGVYVRKGMAVTPSDTNLVNNGRFETANVNAWTTYGSDHAIQINIHGITNGQDRPPESGSYFVRLTGTSGSGTIDVQQTINGLDNGTYTMRAYVRSSEASSACHMEVTDYGGSIQTVRCPDGSEWSQLEITNVNVTSGQATIRFSINDESEWVDIDMVEFFKTE